MPGETPPPLRDYQRLAVKYITNVKRCGLWLEMGLGKTAVVLTAIDPSWFPVLVIAPKKVAEETWPVEIEKWRPDLSWSLAAGERPDEETSAEDVRSAALTAGSDVTIISRDNAHEAISRRVARRPRWKTIIYDESSGLKSMESRRWKVANQLGRRADRVILMTGTPAPNGLLDIWAPMRMLDGGERLGTSLVEYRTKHFQPTMLGYMGKPLGWEVIPGLDEKIYRKIEDIVLGMQAKYRLDLPAVTHHHVPVPFPAKARKVYQELQTEMLVDLVDIFGPEYNEVVTAASGAILSSKYSQLAAGALYPDLESERAGEAIPVHREKRKALRGLIEGLREEGKTALVFYRFRFEAEWIKEAYPEARSIKQKGVIKDWNAGNVPILYAHPASAAHGLNLQFGGHHIIWTSPTWEPELWEQANARLARPGQEHPVVIHVILADRTVDYKVVKRLDTKTTLQGILKEAVESPV